VRYPKKLTACVLALSMALSLCAPALAREETYLAVVTARDAAALEAVEELEGAELLWRYERLFTGAAVEATQAALARMAALPGVVSVERSARREAARGDDAPLTPSNSLDMMQGWDTAYDGDGTVIAVIDSGLRWSHEVFADYGQMKHPAITAEDVAAFVSGGGTAGRYISARIPFAYDYCHGDDEVLTRDDHGTHVSALAAGYAENGDGSVKFRGAAPAAQLLAMKVLPDNGSGAEDAVVLRAMEDALTLGADVVNLSMGVDGGFVGLDGAQSAYRAAFSALGEAGVVICCAAGNGGYALLEQGRYPSASYTDYGMLSVPSVYGEALAVAAAEAAVYEDVGYIEAAGRKIPFTAGAAEVGAVPHPLELAGRRLSLAAVEGVGRAEDFVNVRGRAVVVERGEISFAEKTRNAAAAGAVICLVRNNGGESVTPLVEDIPIPCALISREDGAYLMELAQQGGTVVFRDESFLRRSGRPAMQSASAWGTAADLQLSPALTAPGGSILSAAAAGDRAYETYSGTSMAAPNAAGAFALVLQRLQAEGDRAQRARTAAALLESTACLLETEGGVPLSPRQQGAGLVDLSAALKTDLFITEPLLELGEVNGDSFTLAFRVENRGAETAVCAVDTTVLTDAAAEAEEGWYSLLSPRLITGDCRITAPESVAIPAGDSREVRVTVQLDQALAAELEEIFTNGFFLEGYVTLTAESGESCHASFLGYRGDWEAAPVIEPWDFHHALAAERALWEASGRTAAELGLSHGELVSADMGVNLVWRGGYDFDTAALLGDDPATAEPYLPDRAAIASAESGAVYSEGAVFFLDLFTLRNADRVVMVVSDAATGQVYYVQETEQLPRAARRGLLAETEASARFVWNGTTEGGTALPDGTRVDVDFYAWPESDSDARQLYASRGTTPGRLDSYYWMRSFDRCRQLSFSLTVDRSAPTLAPAAEGAWQISDSRYLAWVQVRDGGGRVLWEEHFADDKPGQPHLLTPDTGGTVYVTAADYAGNLAAWCVEEGAARPCPALLLEDVPPEAWYREALDRVWGEGVMESREGRTFAPELDATRAVLVKALYALAGSPAAKTWELPFTDVELNADYRTALAWAAGEGIAEGFTPTIFGGHATLSRQQLAAMLWRYAGEPERAGALDRFSDGAEAAAWAEPALVWAVEAGVLKGFPDGTLRPADQVSRGELAAVLTRITEE